MSKHFIFVFIFSAIFSITFSEDNQHTSSDEVPQTQEELAKNYETFFKTNFPEKKFSIRSFRKFDKYSDNFYQIIGEYRVRKENNKLTPKYKKFYKKNTSFMLRYFKHYLLAKIDEQDPNMPDEKILDLWYRKKSDDLIKALDRSISQTIRPIIDTPVISDQDSNDKPTLPSSESHQPIDQNASVE